MAAAHTGGGGGGMGKAAGGGRLDAFAQRKAGVVASLAADCGDKSRKGSVDAPVAELVRGVTGRVACGVCVCGGGGGRAWWIARLHQSHE